MQIDRRWALRGIGAVLAASAGRPAFAQNSYPERPIRIIAPSSAGGPYDVIPRFVADYISRKYGWAIAVENRPGASGILGVVAAKQAAGRIYARGSERRHPRLRAGVQPHLALRSLHGSRGDHPAGKKRAGAAGRQG